MKSVWLISGEKVSYKNGELCAPSFLFGKKGSMIGEAEATDAWKLDNGFKSEGAANRVFWHGGYLYKGASLYKVERHDIMDGKYHYDIYRCYEIVIRDKDGNQVGDSEFCYGTRNDALDSARHMLTIADMEG